MALLTLLDIVKRAAGEMGIPRPSAVVGNSDLQAQQLYDFANAVGTDLIEHHHWTALQKVEFITTVEGQSDYDLPSDFLGFISDTEWDTTRRWRMVGPDSPQIDRALRSRQVVIPAYRRFRRYGDYIRINPTPPTSGDTLAYEYISNSWVLAADGTPKSEFTADSDKSIFPPRLIVDGIKMKFMAAKGMYADHFRDEYEARRDRLVAADMGGNKLDMSGHPPADEIDVFSVPSIGISVDDGTELILD